MCIAPSCFRVFSRCSLLKSSYVSVAAFEASNSKILKMTRMDNIPDDILLPPANVKGMKILNRETFSKHVSVPFVEVPIEQIGPATQKLKPIYLKVPKLNPVVNASENKKIIYLNPLLLKPDSKANPEILNFLQEIGFIDDSTLDITLKYDNFHCRDILRAILPDDLGDGVNGYSIIGHIAHFNLKEAYNDYKQIIAQVLLDKFPNLRTVVNKVNTIGNTFRNFEIEVLAGEPNFEVEVKENQYRFKFDFSKVFWNPRLANEHMKICKRISADDLVFDVFAGVGPFAIPAAKKKCTVHANDLNPNAYSALIQNSKLNKVSNYVQTYNLDGREFIETVIKDELVKFYSAPDIAKNIHIIMNLPAIALSFLDTFQNLLQLCDLNEDKFVCQPIVYCYFFVKTNSEELNTKEAVVNHYLNSDMQQGIQEIGEVRLVAPNKTMYRLILKMPFSVLFGKIMKNVGENHNLSEPSPKRIKTD